MAETTQDLAAKTVEAVRSKFGEAVLEVAEHRGETTIRLAPEKVPAVATFLRDHPALRYNYMADLTAVDWPEREPRFDVVYHLLSMETRAVIRLKTRVGLPGEEHPVVPTVSTIWPLPTGTSARSTISLVSPLPGTLTSVVWLCQRTGPATRCAKTIH